MGTIIGDGITFDDVLLVQQYSEVTPNMIELTTHLSLIHIYLSFYSNISEYHNHLQYFYSFFLKLYHPLYS